MPIYEFYCPQCNVIFNFLSRRVNPGGRPDCPRCRKRRLSRQISPFAVTGRAKEAPADGGSDADALPVDDARMERAMETLAADAERIDENDPRQAAGLMRKLSDMTGLKFGDTMEEAIRRMEGGEDPEEVEADLGDKLEGEEDPFVMPDKAEAKARQRRAAPPRRDPKLYEM